MGCGRDEDRSARMIAEQRLTEPYEVVPRSPTAMEEDHDGWRRRRVGAEGAKREGLNDRVEGQRRMKKESEEERRHAATGSDEPRLSRRRARTTAFTRRRR
jgi:hypothetical protein